MSLRWYAFICGFGSDVLFTIDHLRSISFFWQNAHHDWLTKEYISNWFLVLLDQSVEYLYSRLSCCWEWQPVPELDGPGVKTVLVRICRWSDEMVTSFMLAPCLHGGDILSNKVVWDLDLYLVMMEFVQHGQSGSFTPLL